MTPPPHILLRLARPEDVDTIVSFSAAMALETEGRHLDLERLRQGTLSLLNASAYGFFQLAEVHDGQPSGIVAQLMVTYEWSDWRNGIFWWIQSVYVAPAWRRQGVFRRMHDAVLTDAMRRPDVCGVRLYVEEANQAARSAYRRVGLSHSSYAVYEKDFVLAKSQCLEDRPHEA